MDFWVDHPLWLGDYSNVVLDNVYHHYVQTKDHGHWMFKEVMQVTGTVQILFLLYRCWRIGKKADWISLACNAVMSLCFLTMIIPNRDAMSEIGLGYKTSDQERAQFIAHVNSLTNAHVVCLVSVIGGIVADHFTRPLHADGDASQKKLQ